MILRYIALGLHYNTYAELNNNLRYEFQLHTRYISNYFSRGIRKFKFTSPDFNMISIALLPDKEENIARIIPVDVLETYLVFDLKRYKQKAGTEDCSYYLELLENGFKKVSAFRPIPLHELLNLVEEFKKGGCKNEWLHKKKKFKEEDLEIILKCEFTTNYFQLIITIKQMSTKQVLVNGIIIKTEPDEIFFDKMYKDIFINNDNVIITDASDSPRIIINKKKVFMKKLSFQIRGDKSIKKTLSYDL